MSALLKYFIVCAAVHFIGGITTAQAVDDYESELLLKEAIMESNGDYNKHKKRFNHEEMGRANQWQNRDEGAIVIGRHMETITAENQDSSQGREPSSF